MATSFENSVWQIIKKVPAGRVTTYKLIAQAIGKPNSSRAVGNALNKNSDAPYTPCHRVVAATGHIGGYRFGKSRKKKILESEGISFKKDLVFNFSNIVYNFSKKV